MFIQEMGYAVKSQSSLSCSSTARKSLTAFGKTYYLHNSGDYPIYMGNSTGITSTGWELLSNEKSGPWTGSGSYPTLYFLGSTAGSSVLKCLEVAPW